MGQADNSDSAPTPVVDEDARADRRGAKRFMTILRVGKLVTSGQQRLCLIRNISSSGLMAHVYAPHAVGDKVEIELKADQPLRGEIVWVRDEHIGVRFDGQIEVQDILTGRTTIEGRKPRAPRIEVEARARVKVDNTVYRVAVRDISQGGICIDLDEPLKQGDDAVVTVDGMEQMSAIVRWCHEGQVGLSFIKPVAFDDLIRWLDEQDGEERPATA
ncbi:PilZ domain-containing protein [Sphingomonas sp. C3-2]|uniref:PilZ domain-containing protein n=1 Tax=Sphingomonas sp. C3-2 TaxID=3062169 RepID=UPI00294AE9D7|nr:PilZ domain-containing protein [Sphingomonas sp. C3-2]WOK35663.1 PilZ domain-containing protein [Sphingomonas sp. C3-2]